MSRTFLGVCTAIIVSAAMLGAQSPSPDNGGKSSNVGKNAAANAATVTFTGCLTPRTKSDAVFLTNAKEKGAKASATTVKLVPETKKVDLDAFVSKQVEVSGTLDQTGGSAVSADGSGPVPTLTVSKVKLRDDGC